MVTFGLFSLFFSIEPKNERQSAFSLDTFADKTLAITTAVSLVLLVLSTVLGIFQHRDADHQARPPAMADLYRCGPVDRRCRRDTQGRAPA